MSPVLTRRPGPRLLVGAGVALGGFVLGLPSGAGAPAPMPFLATAAADGVRITASVPDFVATDTPVDGGGPTAQAALDSFGTSVAFASTPYPGEAAAGAPSLVAGFTGAPVPSYPLIASASHPATPRASIEQSGYRLDARAEALRAEATAVAGTGATAPSVGSQSEVVIEQKPDGSVVASAVGATQFAVIGGLEIHGVRSTATVTLQPDGTITKAATLEFGTITFGGAPVGFVPGEIDLGDPSVPTDPATTLAFERLADLGFDVTFLAAEETDSTVLSPALRITTQQQVPVAGRPGTFTVILGRATAAMVTTARAPLAVATPAVPLPEGGTGSAPSAGVTQAPAPTLPRVAPATEVPSGVAPAVELQASPSSTVTPSRIDPFGFYWILVVAGGLLLAGSEALRSLGVRS